MNARDLASLRQSANMTQAAIADALGISSRTMSAWEAASPAKELSAIEASAVRDIFRPRLLDEHLIKMCEQAYQAIPSELVAIWLVQGLSCILFPSAARLQDLTDLDGRKPKDLRTHQCVAPMVEKSLTTSPLRIGKPVNRAGDAILNHPDKKYKSTRLSHLFEDGVCESLLHVPAFAQSARGPLPVLLLSLENKLARERDGAFRAAKVDADEGRPANPPKIEILKAGAEQMLYTPDDVEIAERLAEDFADMLLPKMQLLGIIE